MANTSQSKQDKTLRIGVIQQGHVVEETLVRDRRSMTFGADLKNEIVLASEGAPSSFTLFEATGDKGYTLHVDPSMRGQVQIGDRTVSMGGPGDTSLVLTDDAEGSIAIGTSTIVFQFVDAPPIAAIPPFPANMRASIFYVLSVGLGLTSAFFLALFISGVIHGTLVGLGYVIPPPPRDEGNLVLNARLTRLLVEVVPEEPVEIIDPTEEDDTLVVEEDDSIVAEAPADKSSGKDKEPSSGNGGKQGGDSAGALTGIDQVVAGSAFGALMNADGGMNLGLVDAGSESERSAAEALANQQASGGTGAGVVADNLGAIGSGTGDGSGRIGIGGDGSSAVADAAKAGAATTAQEQVRVKPNVGDRGQRMAGSGELSESEVRGVLGRFQRRVERCYERTLASNPSASGRVELQFRVDASGQTSDARMPTNELGDTFGNCILTEVRRLRFSPPSGGSVTVSQRYILQPGR